MLPAGLFKTEFFMHGCNANLDRYRLLTPGQRGGIIREWVEAERQYLLAQAKLPDEYEEALAAQDAFEGL